MSKSAFGKIQAGLNEGLAYARGEDVEARVHVFLTAEARLRKNVARWVETTEVQDCLRRNHAALKDRTTRR